MCTRTYSTLRIFSDVVDPESISKTLGLEPTYSFRTGDAYSVCKLTRKYNGWLLSTESSMDSQDTEEHIGSLLAKLHGKAEAVAALHVAGCELDIFSYWTSNGQGGPSLTAEQMLILGKLGIPVSWDVYVDEEPAP
jgi:hypothetical protein